MVSLPDTKNNRPHAFPIAPLAAGLIEHTPKFESDYIFPARGTQSRSFNGWSKSKFKLDKAIAKAGHDMAPWTLHDLRRTFATNLAALGVAPHITERLLNHVSGTISGVAAIYNRHAYLDEMRDAITKWERRLVELIERAPHTTTVPRAA